MKNRKTKNNDEPMVTTSPSNASSSFPWDAVGKRNGVGMSRANKVVAQSISIGMGYAELAVCRTLNVGMGGVKKAIVFDKIHVGMSCVDELHCLSSTTQVLGMGIIKNVKFHSMEELVQMALETLDMNSLLSHATTTTTTTTPSAPSSTTDEDEGDLVVVPVKAHLATTTDKEETVVDTKE